MTEFQRCLTVVWVAMLPVLELRAAIPLGLSLGLPAWQALALGTFGSMVPVAPIMFGLQYVRAALQRSSFGRGFLDRYQAKASGVKAGMNKYGLWALAAFVAIPLPSTGAWTGSIIASLLGLRFWPSFFAIAVGTVVAGLIVMWMSVVGFNAVSGN